MITPALPRWVASVLNAPGNGVNLLAPLVPRGASDPEPPFVAIYNAVDDAWVARKRTDEEATPDAWVLRVRVGEEMQVAGAADVGNLADIATIIVELDGVTADDQDNAVVLAMAYRIMRAVRRCLLQEFIALRGETLMLEGELIELPDTLHGITLDGKDGSGQVGLALALPFTLTDTWALGAEETV